MCGAWFGRQPVWPHVIYEVMRVWDGDRFPSGTRRSRDCGGGGASQNGRTLASVGPNATLVADDLEAVARRLKAERVGEIDVVGPDLAQSLTDYLGLIDGSTGSTIHPVVLGHGKPFFAGPRPRLRLVASDQMGEGR